MDQIEYIGEHLWLGQLGHSMVLMAFVSCLFSAYCFYEAEKTKHTVWKQMARVGFGLHGVALLVVIGLLFYAMHHRMFEYIFVFNSVSDHLPTQYIFSAFWADQEGSFMLWMFWHIVLGGVMIWKGRRWEAPVMVSLCLIQVFIISMIVGIYAPFGGEDARLGSSPFVLIRDYFGEAPIFANADYLSMVQGKGLNPLLQNYWMTIHPPVLFLGFASMTIPFCYAIAGLATREHSSALKSVKNWGVFGAFILGLGILMGSAWAYEALTFGGYWAWDPVENSSFVPWLLVVAGLHTNLVANKTGYSVRYTYVYYVLALVFTLYSTFLTRSGVLGDTSVHAFTTMGLEVQLVAFIVFAVGLAIYNFWRSGDFPVKEKEEPVASREFWMFVGALTLMFSGALMTISTSLPVYNKIIQIFDPTYEGLVIQDPVSHHNQFQIWIGVAIGFLTGCSVLLRYKAFNWDAYKKRFYTHLLVVGIVSLVGTYFIGRELVEQELEYYLFLWAGLFAIVANLDYLVSFLQSNLKQAGAVLSHVGFGVLVLGILFTGLNQSVISSNPFAQRDILSEDNLSSRVVLIKDKPMFTTAHWITYEGDTLVGNLRKYALNFKKVDKSNNVIDEFTTYPSAIYSADFTKIEAFNPGTTHKWAYDVFTEAQPPLHQQDVKQAQMIEDSIEYKGYSVQLGDTIASDGYQVVWQKPIFDYHFESGEHNNELKGGYDLTVAFETTVIDSQGRSETVYPGLGLKEGLIFQFPALLNSFEMKVKISDSTFNSFFTEEKDLSYDRFQIREGETITYGGYQLRLVDFNQNPTHQNYKAEQGDLAVGAVMELSQDNRVIDTLQSLYIIRGLQPFSIKDYSPSSGMHVRFTHIDPDEKKMTFLIAQDARQEAQVNYQLAFDVPRSDLLVVRARKFPGINLVWVGCLAMIGGLLMSLLGNRPRM